MTKWYLGTDGQEYGDSEFDSESERLHCRCCGANLAREGHLPDCENLDPEPEPGEEEDDYEGGDDSWTGESSDFDPYSGCEIFDRNEGDSE